MTFDMQKASKMCDRLKFLHDENKKDSPTVEFHVSPKCNEKRIHETIDLANRAALELPAALAEIEQQAKRIAELEKALVEERSKIFHQFGDMELDSSEDDRRMARQQLRQEGLL